MVMSIFLQLRKPNWMVLFPLHSLNLKDITKQSGGFLVYIKSSVPSRQLSYGSICNSIQAIPFEINLRQEKWLVISIYRRPKTVDFLYIL